MAPASRNPSNWDDYHGRASPSGSLTSSILAEEQALLTDDGADDDGDDDDGHGPNSYARDGRDMTRRR
ncbi:hypothetical protein G7046_g10172 [Stylonectria norvegica]|nr:hypothetical protein G7046_g10172 [Stylonectria norvegica]